ncbi:MAG: prenyltransferase, partial [Myxococcales bacterium]|nr:prenyltransferase [Myxococcales bacterium]
MSDPLGEATGAVTSKAPGNGPGGVLSRWVFALKPQSWPKLLVPAALGQALGVAHTERWSWPPLIVGVLFTVFGGAFIVLANDWADQEVDRLKRDMFPAAGSPKTIPDGVLGERSVAKGAAVAAGFAASVAVLGALWLSVASLAWLGLGGIAVFAAYSLPPLRLNYRGGGEFLEAFGVGVVLPLFNAVAQGGSPANWAAAMALPGFSCLALASALASGLSDEESDRAGGK